MNLFIRNKKDDSIHKVWKVIFSDSEDRIDVWCNTWYGHHVIGQDCEFEYNIIKTEIENEQSKNHCSQS